MSADQRDEASDHLKRAIALTSIYFAHPDGVPDDAPERTVLDSYLATEADRQKMISGLAALCGTLLRFSEQATGEAALEILRQVAEANRITL